MALESVHREKNLWVVLPGKEMFIRSRTVAQVKHDFEERKKNESVKATIDVVLISPPKKCLRVEKFHAHDVICTGHHFDWKFKSMWLFSQQNTIK